MSKVYICFQSGNEATIAEGYNTNILGVTDTEDKARAICNHNGDSYYSVELNKDLGRMPEDTTDVTWYNEEGEFHSNSEDSEVKEAVKSLKSQLATGVFNPILNLFKNKEEENK